VLYATRRYQQEMPSVVITVRFGYAKTVLNTRGVEKRNVQVVKKR